MSTAELKQLIESIAISQRETDRIVKETSLSIKDTDRQMKETDRQMKETDRKLKELGKQIGGLGNKFGAFAEGLAFSSIERNDWLIFSLGSAAILAAFAGGRREIWKRSHAMSPKERSAGCATQPARCRRSPSRR